jgi:hypothetical protein
MGYAADYERAGVGMTEQNHEEPTAETVSTAVVAPPRAALVAHQDVMAIMPRSIEEAARYARGLAASGNVPDAFKVKGSGEPNEPLIMMGVLKAMELGVPPQTGLAGLLPINGRFSVWGDLAAALVQQTGKVQNQTVRWVGPAFDEGEPIGLWPDDFGCTVSYWRLGQEEPYTATFLVRDAKRAGLWNNARRQPWIQHPKRMLFNRARAFVLRDGFADGLSGLAIAEEVMDHLPPPVDERGPSRRLSSLVDDEGETDDEA